ncbi:Triacylglycerol lipase 1 [Acorus calamus]|uniref:Lipase n=1 Tax=Acorus calamus TaxID=4465 RepID=A0AAV9CSK2_ACOCL|nr:Triacylglycerol lipase 1 [Acorus calamus]
MGRCEDRVTSLFLHLCLLFFGRCLCKEQINLCRPSHRTDDGDGLCARLIRPLGYPCFEHTVQTKDGYLLAVQHIPHGRGANRGNYGPPIFLQHGLFEGGDAWFLNSVEESLGFIFADHGFDVWVGNVRGTHWSHGHVSLSEKKREFWDWSWQELAQYDLVDMVAYVYSITNSKIFFVGHSQGTIMALAAFTQLDIVNMIEAAALLSPISYLDHITSRFVLRAVGMSLDKMLLRMGIHQLNFRSDFSVEIMDSLCDGHLDCNNLLSSITGDNCCFNMSRIEFYLEYEPHPSSTKNLNHLFQMIRKGTFGMYDYGIWGNLKKYRHLHPPSFDLSKIPKSLPLWMAYGGNDALADVTDVKHMLMELPSKPELLYLDSYGHIDFIMSTNARADVYENLIRFFKSWGWRSSF